ncbi:unnamed protein product, partial [Medioppia subpectinata]
MCGKKSDSGGDEERAYILFHRFFTSIKTVKKSEDYKKDEKYYSNMIGMNKVKEVVERMEALATSLMKRYDLLKEINELTERELNGTVNSVSINNSNSNDLNETKKPKSIETVDESGYPLIDCQTLVESLENTTEMNKILILDTRTPEEYSVSHIDKLRTTADLNVVNIPQNLLIPGLTTSKLDSDLPLGNTLDVFRRRRSMSKVIIADLHSHEVIANTPAFHLAEALWKWDYSSIKLKNKPFLLKGGYADWVLTYPMFTSNPKYISKSLPLNANKSLNLGFNYDLSEFEDKPKTPNNLMVNGFTNGDIEEATQSQKGSDAEQQANRVNHIFNTRPTNVAIPGTAKPLIPDRSTKPIVQPEMSSSNEPKIEDKEDVEKIKLRKVNEINEQMMENMREDFEGKVQLLNNQLNIKNKENKNLMEAVRKAKPPSLVSNDLNDTNDEKPVIAINGETNGLNKRNAIYMKVDDSGDKNTSETDLPNGVMNGHRMSNSITSTHKGANKSSNSLSVSSNLSRSISSPNIAQLLEKEMNGKHMDNIDTNEAKERSMTTPSQPQFDRTLKPAINREKLYFNDSTVIEDKVRDFCPVRSGGTSITGLKNLGNTCYSNAVVQCLLNTTEFSSFFSRNLKINKNSKYGSNGELVMELAALFRHMAYPSFYTMLSAKDFRQAVSKHIKDFVPGAQQDSHEFLVKLFEKLHDDLNDMSKVIIADLHSHEVIANTPAFHLAEALWKWDYSSIKLKNKPFLLKGGYADWVLTYPMFTSNPKYISKSLPLNANKSLNLGFNYDLSEFEDKPKTPNNLMVNGFTNGDIEEATQSQKGSDAEQQANRVNHIFNTRPTNVAIPGTAKPLIPDRSTKPIVQPEISSSNEPKIEDKEDVEKIKLRKVNEINEQMMESMREDFDGKVQLLNNELNNKNKENKNLMEAIRKAKPPSLVSNDLKDTNDEKPVIAINGETNGLNKRNAIYMKVDDSGDNNTTETDLTNGVMNGHRMSNSITSTHKGVNKSSNSLSVSSNLSRSISSPNIAQ